MMTDVPANLSAIILAAIAFLGLAVPGWLAWLQARKNHVMMNSRLTELLDATRKSAKAEGKVEGAAEEKQRAG